MDLLSELNAAMRYVEAHLDDDLASDDVSSVTSYSPYHFGRLFYYIAGMPLSEYIRKRKLSLAAAELQSGGDRVIDLAVKYGYDSADSFTRAFVKQHGITPTAARQFGATLKIFLPLTFQIKVQGVNEMNWRIEEREAFEVFGIERIFRSDETGKVTDFWTECIRNGEDGKFVEASGETQPKTGELLVKGICGYRDTGAGSFPYMLGVYKSANSKADGYTTAVIPKSTWAIFRSGELSGFGQAIPELFNRAYSEWLPGSGYAKADAADLELYYLTENGKCIEEVWIPVRKL
ncbi:MAG: AraC family transcriptional regulator [Oscillospiraceae bacterium]|jgi:AraC family transcriptional regulator|nr:AraC family transcriptional regulator [Oscillospiraceae bacterium]